MMSLYQSNFRNTCCRLFNVFNHGAKFVGVFTDDALSLLAETVYSLHLLHDDMTSFVNCISLDLVLQLLGYCTWFLISLFVRGHVHEARSVFCHGD